MTGPGAVVGVGSALPERRVTSAEIEERLGLEAGWIEKRTGILERRIAGPNEATSDLAVRAGGRALTDARVPPSEVGLLLLATSTPDHPLPPTAPAVAHRLALSSCMQGGHALWWVVEADSEQEALRQLPEYVSERSEVTRVRSVPIP